MSSVLPSPIDDYAAPTDMDLTAAAWNAVMGSIGARLRALEAVEASFEALITLGTGQALASIAANIEPELVAARAALTQLQTDTALAQDVVAQLVTGSVPLGSVEGLAAALAGIAASIAALRGSAPALLDTLEEIAAALAAEDSAVAAINAALAQRLRVDADQGLSAAQAARGRANLGVGGKASARNRHINPGFRICQDRATGATIVIAGSGSYVMDGVIAYTDVGALTCSQVIKPTPGGSPTRARFAVSASGGVGAASFAGIGLPIEGVDVADLQFGTAAARPFVWRGILAAPAGTYHLAFRNATATMSYVVPVVVSAAEAGADKPISITVPGATTGAWVNDASGQGISVAVTFAAGPSLQTAAINAWQVGNYVSSPAQTNGMASTGNVYEVADIGLYAGSELPAWEMPAYADDLLGCQRYYGILSVSLVTTPANSLVAGLSPYPCPVRASPALSLVVASSSNVASITVAPLSTAVRGILQAGATGNADWTGQVIYSNRL